MWLSSSSSTAAAAAAAASAASNHHRGSANNLANGNVAALNGMLSQLTFQSEAVPKEETTEEDVGCRFCIKESLLHGLFCLDWKEEEYYYDAVEDTKAFSWKNDEIKKGEGWSGAPTEKRSRKHHENSNDLALLRVRGGDLRPRSNNHDHGPTSRQQIPSSPQHHPSFQRNKQSTPRSKQRNRDPSFQPLQAPPAPKDVPLRFMRAGKGNPDEAQKRYQATLQWREEQRMNGILSEAHPQFSLIKHYYPHYYHLKGRKGEPVFFEQPPKTNLAALRKGGVTLDTLLRHYAMVTEFGWQFLVPDDMAQSITILDLEGMRMRDFVGDCVDYVRKCSAFTGQHYPERAGYIMVLNVPSWFAMIWKIVQPMVDEVTLRKIAILKRGKPGAVLDKLLEKIPLENIPPEYGGTSMPLGESPEEVSLRQLMEHNLAVSNGDKSCGGRPHCPFCSFQPARSY